MTTIFNATNDLMSKLAIPNDIANYITDYIANNYINIVDIDAIKCRENAYDLEYAHGYEDSGMDVKAAAIAIKETNGEWVEYCEYLLQPGEIALVKSGWCFNIPKGLEIQVRPTSGNSLKTKLRVLLGTVDSGYQNEVGVIIENIGNKEIRLVEGAKVGQLVLVPVYHARLNIVDKFINNDSLRGMNGFGSTGTIETV